MYAAVRSEDGNDADGLLKFPAASCGKLACKGNPNCDSLAKRSLCMTSSLLKKQYGGMERHFDNKKLLAFLLFAFISCIVFWPVLEGIGSRINGSADDAYAIIWQIWWYKFALLDLYTSPSFSAFVEAPFGVGVTHTTIINHVLALPLTALFGAVASYNLMILLSFVWAGLGMYFLAFEVTKCAAASFIAGLIYSFSPYHTVFSASGGMDGAQIQYIPFTIYFLLRFESTRSTKDLVLLFIFLLATFLSFGYYAALIALAIAIYLAYTRAIPLIAKYYEKIYGAAPSISKIMGLCVIAYLVFVAILNAFEAAAPFVKALALASVPIFLYSVADIKDGEILKGIYDRFNSFDKRSRVLIGAGLMLLFLSVLILLAPVFSASSRNISSSYLVPWYSYFIPSKDHPLFGGLVPGSLVPSPDPFSGKMVYLGLAVPVLALISFFRIRAGKDLRKESFLMIFFAGALLSIPPVIRIGDFTFYGPIYFFHKAVPPFVDVRRMVLLLILAASVLGAVAVADLRSFIRNRFLRGGFYLVLTAIIAVEFYPNIAVKDVSKTPSAYSWLSSQVGGLPVIEYPMTSIYDSKRYEVFYAQRLHGKKVVNPFGATGHDPNPANRHLKELLGSGGAASEIFVNTDNAVASLSSVGVRYIIIRKDKYGADLRLQGDGVRLAADFPDSSVYEAAADDSGAYVSFSDFHKTGHFKNYLAEKDGRYEVKNPYVMADGFFSEGRYWMWMSKAAGLKVTGKKDRLYDVRFYARSIEKDAVITISDEKGLLKEFTITGVSAEYGIEGLKAGAVLKIELKNAEAAGYLKGFTNDGPNGTQASVAFSSFILKEAEDGSKAGSSIINMYDGLFVRGL